jgi:flagellar protein FlgJ
MPRTEDRQQGLQQIARIAVALEAQTGCPSQLLIAQWALESSWGAKPVGHANYFGVKAHPQAALTCTVTTHEVVRGEVVQCQQLFADYGSLADSCQDYVRLITQGAPYRAAWARYQDDHDLQALIEGVAGRYSTAPQYATLVAAIAGQGNVAQAITEARQEGSNASA